MQQRALLTDALYLSDNFEETICIAVGRPQGNAREGVSMDIIEHAGQIKLETAGKAKPRTSRFGREHVQDTGRELVIRPLAESKEREDLI